MLHKVRQSLERIRAVTSKDYVEPESVRIGSERAAEMLRSERRIAEAWGEATLALQNLNAAVDWIRAGLAGTPPAGSEHGPDPD